MVIVCLNSFADTLLEENKMTKEAAKIILDTFDQTVAEIFDTQVAPYTQSDPEITVMLRKTHWHKKTWQAMCSL